MKVKVIVMTDGDWCIGDSYAEALDRLDHYVNEDYYREQHELQDGKTSGPELYDKQEVVPKMMVLTDDPKAYVDRYGAVCTKGGYWTLQIPLARDRAPIPSYRFSLMQRLKDEDFKREVETHLEVTYGDEFNAWCQKRTDGICEGCVFNDVDKTAGKPTCFRLWYEKYKKPEIEKEKKE